MAWYDYVPIVSNVAGLAKGSPSQAIGGVAGYALTKPGQDAATNAANAQRSAIDDAMKRLQQFSSEQYANRMGDLDKTMAFYGPAQRYLESIYGGAPGGMPGMPTGNGGASRAPAPAAGPSSQPPGFPKLPPIDPLSSFGGGGRRGF